MLIEKDNYFVEIDFIVQVNIEYNNLNIRL